MRWSRSLLMVTFALIVVATGCQQRRYLIADLDLYVPEESAWCFNACEQQYNECLTSCPPQDVDCHCECRVPRRQCFLSCPGTIQEDVSPELQGIAEAVCPQ